MSSFKPNNLPEVRIEHSWLLTQSASEDLNKLHGDGTPLQSFEYYTDVADRYQKAWDVHGEKILEAMQEILGMHFRQNTIDVHVAPWFYAFSSPMVLGVRFNDDQLLATLTHEILHRLLTDNIETSYDTDYLALWKEMFGEDHSNITLVHIPVHAMSEAIFVDVLSRPELVVQDKEEVKDNPDYAAAWDYVESEGYENIISKLKLANFAIDAHTKEDK